MGFERDANLQRVLLEVGGLHALARSLDMSWQSLQKWKRIPAHRILEIEALTGIPREQLRPDLYGPALRRKRK